MADNVEFGMNMNFGDSFKNLSELKKKISEIEDTLKKTSDPKIVEGLSNALNKLTGDLNKFKNEMISTITIMKNADKQVFSNIGKGLSTGFNLAIQSVNAMNSSTQQLVNTLKQAQGAAAFNQVGSATRQNTSTGTSRPSTSTPSGTTDYELLKIAAKELDNQVNSLRLSMMALEEQGEKTSSQYSNLRTQLEKLAPQAAELRGKLSSVQMATAQGTVVMDKYAKATGQGSKSNKNFVYETNSMQQVLRELPSFAYGAQTGLMALSNNLPILADNFKAMAQATDNATGKAVGFKGALLEMVKSIGSPMGLISLGITALTAFGPAIYNYIAGTEDAEKAEKAAEEQKKRLLEIEKKRIAQLRETAGIINNEKFAIVSLYKQIEMSIPGSERRNELIAEYNKLSYITIKNTKDEAKFQKQLEYIERKNIEWITHRIGIKINESYLEKLMTEEYIRNAKLKGMADKKAWYDSKVDREEQLRLEINAAESKGKLSKKEWADLNKLKQERWALNDIVNRDDLLKMSDDYDKLTVSAEKNSKEQKRVMNVIGELSRLIPAMPDPNEDKVKKSKKSKEDLLKLDKEYYGKEGDIEKMLLQDFQNLENIRVKIHKDALEKELLMIEEQYDTLLLKAQERYNTETDLLFKIYSDKKDVIDMEKEYQVQIDNTKDKVKKLSLVEELKNKKDVGFQTFLIDEPQAIRSLDLLTRTITNLTKQMQKDMTEAARKGALERYNTDKNLNRKLSLERLIEDKKTNEIRKQFEQNFWDEVRDINIERSKSYREKPKQVVGESGATYEIKQLDEIKKKRDALIETNPTANLVGEYELAIKQLEGTTKSLKQQFEEYDKSYTIFLEKRKKADKEYTIEKSKLSDKQRKTLQENNETLKNAQDFFTSEEKTIKLEQERLLLKKEQLALSKEENREGIDKFDRIKEENKDAAGKYLTAKKKLEGLNQNNMFDAPEVIRLDAVIKENKAGYEVYNKAVDIIKAKKQLILDIDKDIQKTEDAITNNSKKDSENQTKINAAKAKIAATNKVLSASEQILAKKPAEIEKQFQDSIKTLDENFLKFLEIRKELESKGLKPGFELDKQAFEELIKKLNEDPNSKVVVEIIPQLKGTKEQVKKALTPSEVKEQYEKRKEEFTQRSTALALKTDETVGGIVSAKTADIPAPEVDENGRVKFKKKEQFRIDGINRDIRKAELDHEKELLVIKQETIGVTEEELWRFHEKEMEFWREDRSNRVKVAKEIADSLFGIAQSTLDVLSAMTNNSINLMNEKMALQEQKTQNVLDGYDREIDKIQNLMDTQSMSDTERINSTQKIMDLQKEKALQEKNQKVAQLEMQKQQIQVSKNMALAQIAISGGVALGNVVAIATEGALGTGPAAPFVFAAELAAGLAAVGTNIFAAKTAIESADYQTQTIDAQIEGINNSYAAGLSNASSAVSGSAGKGPTAPLTTFNADLVNQGQSNANYNLDGDGLKGYKIYVTQADIQNANNQVTKIKKKTTFG